MRRKTVKTDRARIVLTGMILSTEALRRVSMMYRPGMFRVDFADLVAEWCLDYFQQYGKAPGKDIEGVYHRKMLRMSEEQQGNVEALLSRLSAEWERDGSHFNASFAVDTAVELFKENHLRAVVEDLNQRLETGDVPGAETALAGFSTVQAPHTDAINPYTDEEAIRRAFDAVQEPLFTFPGDFGKMVNRQLVRGGFLAWMGREKIGKTWYLDLMAHQAAKCRCNVAFFQVGDMTEEDMIVRKHTSLSGIPSDPDLLGETLRVPREIVETDDPDADGNCGVTGYDVVYDEEKVTTLLDAAAAIQHGKVFAHRLRGRDFKLFTFPNDTVNVRFIRDRLDVLAATELWIPDVIVIDYADILSPEPDSAKEFRHQQNKTWKALRALAQERHCLVITATQADAASYDPSVNLSMRNFSEDKRKLSHVTAMAGLNQTEGEKECGLLRVNWIVLRKGRFASSRFCYLLQCLEKGRPLIKSYFLKPRGGAAHP